MELLGMMMTDELADFMVYRCGAWGRQTADDDGDTSIVGLGYGEGDVGGKIVAGVGIGSIRGGEGGGITGCTV